MSAVLHTLAILVCVSILMLIGAILAAEFNGWLRRRRDVRQARRLPPGASLTDDLMAVADAVQDDPLEALWRLPSRDGAR